MGKTITLILSEEEAALISGCLELYEDSCQSTLKFESNEQVLADVQKSLSRCKSLQERLGG